MENQDKKISPKNQTEQNQSQLPLELKTLNQNIANEKLPYFSLNVSNISGINETCYHLNSNIMDSLLLARGRETPKKKTNDNFTFLMRKLIENKRVKKSQASDARSSSFCFCCDQIILLKPENSESHELINWKMKDSGYFCIIRFQTQQRMTAVPKFVRDPRLIFSVKRIDHFSEIMDSLEMFDNEYMDSLILKTNKKNWKDYSDEGYNSDDTVLNLLNQLSPKSELKTPTYQKHIKINPKVELVGSDSD